MTDFALAFAAEYKGFMKAHSVSGAQIAAVLDRGEGYVSERVNGKRALDTNDVDALASLVPEWDGLTLMLELSRRAESRRTPRGELIEGNFGSNVGAPVEDEPTMKQPPKKQRTAARKGETKAAQAPHAE
ncbi:MAG: hypothetical protein J0I43_01705 [Microbacterium sp.]|uniref:hypothetical protein n=1 Tax=Microbacterium sp. TaxID=51671 RepID=UPI001ACD2955|nr:hypothetical protein [Microbacterium sp.]MBN9176073.1 hypothetical protein [Microbacterium sp.]